MQSDNGLTVKGMCARGVQNKYIALRVHQVRNLVRKFGKLEAMMKAQHVERATGIQEINQMKEN